MFDVPSKKPVRRSTRAANYRPHSGATSFGAPIAVSNQSLQRHLRSQRLRGNLAVGGVHDAEEAEADRTADNVMAGEIGTCACGGTCDSCRSHENTLRRKPAAAAGAQIRSARAEAFGSSAGRPLDTGARTFFEPHFGDLSDVRVHDGEEAASTAAAIGARAYAVGADIGFAAGAYAPGGGEGRKLLAHELAHVAQASPIVRRRPEDTLPSPVVGAPQPISLMLDPSQMCGPQGCFTDADIDALARTSSDPSAGAPQAGAAAKPSVEDDDDPTDQPSTQTVNIGPFAAVALTTKGPTPAPTPPAPPTNVARIVQGSTEARVAAGTTMMATKTGHQPTTFGQGNLAGADEVSIIAHGRYGYARIGTQLYPARQLAEELVASGWKGGTVRLIICKTGLCGPMPSAFGQELANELAALGADSAVIAPAGNANIASGIPGLPQVRSPPTNPRLSPRGWDWEVYVAEAPKEPSFFSPKAWSSVGVGALKTGALIALSILHGRAVVERMQKQAQETGFAPVGPTGNRLYDLGAWFLDPTNEAGRSVPFSQQFHMAKWRETVRDAADKKAVGETYKMPWETDDGWDALHEHRKTKTCYVYYRKGPNGYWYTIKGSCSEDEFFPPDLNKVIDPNVPDEELRQYLELPAESSGGELGGLA